MDLVIDDPEFVREAMKIQGEFAAGLAERVLKDVVVDAALFSEPIGGNYGPLISPQMYEDMVLRSYEPVLDVHVDVFKRLRKLELPGLDFSRNCV